MLQTRVDAHPGSPRTSRRQPQGAPSQGMLVLAKQQHFDGNLDEAARLYRLAMASDPAFLADARLHVLLAQVLIEAERFVEALPSCAKLVELAPDRPDSYQSLGRALLGLGRAPLAVGAFAMMVSLDQRNAQAHTYLAYALQHSGRLAEAEISYQEALRLLPDNGITLCNISVLRIRAGRYAEALDLCDRALALDPNCFPGLGNRSVALFGLGRHEEAIALGRKVLALKPADPEAQHNLGAWLLTTGQLTPEAWTLLEGRHRLRGMKPRAFDQPQWLGEDVAGRTILVHADAGFGDTLQFARYLPLLVRQGARVIVEAYAPLHRLLRDIDGLAGLFSRGEPLPPFDLHCSFGSLPRAFDTTLATIPRDAFWFRPANRPTRHPSARPLRVGLVWAGNREFMHDQQRSLALSDFLPLWDVPDVAFVSLQAGAAAEDLGTLPPTCLIEDTMAGVSDYYDTAERVAALDLVICVDTSVAHLAGAMAKPVWMLSRHNGCWRWLLDRSDSPWYPTMTIYRQPAPGDWKALIHALCADLWTLVAARGS